MFDTPLRYCRPARSFDGGDVYEHFDRATTLVLFGDLNIHDGEIRITVPEDTDLRIGDLIETEYSTRAYGTALANGGATAPAATASGSAAVE